MIVARDVVKRFGEFTALNGVSIEVPAGALTALLGPSGSGKSTLLRVIAGLETPDAGTVEIDGRDATRLSPQKRGVGFVFQHYAAFKHMTVRDNIAFGLTVRKRSKAEIRERVDELSSPAASGSGWRSLARSRSSRRCCCSTSRSAPSTRACGSRCASGCGTSTTRCT